ncbi:hypothetical protein M9H77_30156 [Catharanthus roseus]|uniref:Uncharacterized protein n=1 Tax=Catharanthus roseus TaxID=4058 RepID=A0ACB9ZXA4_CATRO|nr:hypothetical protein M9H77_30156 [Catharanthus roseus]
MAAVTEEFTENKQKQESAEKKKREKKKASHKINSHVSSFLRETHSNKRIVIWKDRSTTEHPDTWKTSSNKQQSSHLGRLKHVSDQVEGSISNSFINSKKGIEHDSTSAPMLHTYKNQMCPQKRLVEALA